MINRSRDYLGAAILAIVAFVLIALAVTGCAVVPPSTRVHHQYNYLQHRTEPVDRDSVLRYNPYQGEWQYAPWYADLGYNPHEDRWEFRH